MELLLNTRPKQRITKSMSIEETLRSLIARDLFGLNWRLLKKGNGFAITPPAYYEKDEIRNSMSLKRQQILEDNSEWIDKNISMLRNNLATGNDAFNSEIHPIIEVCKTQRQHDLFRLCRYYWSSPYSDYVGRRIKLLIRDAALPNNPIIGIIALGSSIVHIPDRDNWIGWSIQERTDNLIYTMDAYVLGAMPPYNKLLGGKLLSYIITANEIRDIYKAKYENQITKTRQRIADDLACIFTTSLYGRSSQYNRLTYNNRQLFTNIGETKGYGSLHLSEETFECMCQLLRIRGIIISNKFGDGPNWRMRVIRTASNVIGLSPDALLNHSFKRSIYCIPLARNYKEFLCNEENTLDYYDNSLFDVVTYWHQRWLMSRKLYLTESDKLRELRRFDPQGFTL
jgi:hypothetical protein